MEDVGRYGIARPPRLAQGWTLERLTPPSRMYGANGLRGGPDGRIYVAQCVGSQISALDVETGQLETISARGGDIISPDDLAFDDQGNLYITEFMEGRVSVRGADGNTRVLRDDLPGANGITFHKGRLFVDECRPNGRFLELDLNGGAPRVLLDNVSLPNAMAPGPDGLLYFPLVGAGEIWRIDPDSGSAERVIGGLNHPSAVKFDADGYLVVTIAPTGEVLRIDPQSGERIVMARLDSALDNLAYIGDRLFVSHMVDGRVTEIAKTGQHRDLLPGGLHGPLDLAIGDDGLLYIADQIAFYALSPAHGLQCLGRIYGPGYPGAVRGVASAGNHSFAVSTAGGRVVIYRPWAGEYEVLAEGFDQLYGIAIAPGGAIVVAELGTGRVLSLGSGRIEILAAGLSDPIGIAIGPDGSCYVSEAGAGRVVRLVGGAVETVVDGLIRPQGIVLHAGQLIIVDPGAQAVIAVELETGARSTISTGLPIGATPGVIPKLLRGAPPLVGPLGPFAGITVDAQGTLYVSADAEGSIIALRPAA